MEEFELIKKAKKMIKKEDIIAISIKKEEVKTYLFKNDEIIPIVILCEWKYNNEIIKFIKVNNIYKVLRNGEIVELKDDDEIQIVITLYEENNKIFVNYCGEICYLSYKNKDAKYSATIYIENMEYQISILITQDNKEMEQITQNSFIKLKKNKVISEMMKRYFKVVELESEENYE